MQLHVHVGVDFREGGKPENPEKNPRSMGEINHDNSIHMSPKFEIQLGGCTQMVTHPATHYIHIYIYIYIYIQAFP